MSANNLQQSYDKTPYPTLCYTQTHPNRLATLATLLGVSPAPIDNSRVLELGCASGGNLIPMAYTLPNSTFVGIDFSASQIEAGKAVIDALGLENITLLAQDIRDLDSDFDEFDYIIAHGVYSWVPESVQEKVLEICQYCLTPDGVAYISYNTYPGWHMLGALRDMMLYHTREIEDPHQQVTEARELLAFLEESVRADDPYGTFSRAYGDMLQAYNQFVLKEREQEEQGDELLLHDELEAVNQPVYFHQFAAHAAQYGLQYLVEADFARVVPTNFAKPVQEKLFQLAGDIIEMEQYMDFVRNRTFRQTLLCRDNLTVQRRMQVRPSAFADFHLATYARPENPEMDIHAQQVEKFRGPDGSTLSTDHPVTKAAMLYLAYTAPKATPFADLFNLACEKVYGEQAESLSEEVLTRDAHTMIANLLQAYSYSMRLVELHVHAPEFALDPGERPFASPIARLQTEAGLVRVANLRHERVKLDEVSRRLLPHLDGRHTRDDLLQILRQMVKEEEVTITHNDKPVTEEGDLDAILQRELIMNLRWLARAALLERHSAEK